MVFLNETGQHQIPGFGKKVLCSLLLRFAQSQIVIIFCLLLCPPLRLQGEPPSPCQPSLRAFPLNNAAANNNQKTLSKPSRKKIFYDMAKGWPLLVIAKTLFLQRHISGKEGSCGSNLAWSPPAPPPVSLPARREGALF